MNPGWIIGANKIVWTRLPGSRLIDCSKTALLVVFILCRLLWALFTCLVCNCCLLVGLIWHCDDLDVKGWFAFSRFVSCFTFTLGVIDRICSVIYMALSEQILFHYLTIGSWFPFVWVHVIYTVKPSNPWVSELDSSIFESGQDHCSKQGSQ